MKDFQRRRTVRRLLYSPLAIVLLLALLVPVAKATWGVYQKERESNERLKRATEELAALEARRALLEERTDRLKTREGLEAALREQFPVAKPGEKMVVIVEESATGEAKKPEQSLLSKFLDLFR